MNYSILNSWKEIASYLERGVRTVQRWEREKRLPVHRIRSSPKSPVFAFRTEMDSWVRENPITVEQGETSAPLGRTAIRITRLEFTAGVRCFSTSIAYTAQLVAKQVQSAEAIRSHIARISPPKHLVR